MAPGERIRKGTNGDGLLMRATKKVLPKGRGKIKTGQSVPLKPKRRKSYCMRSAMEGGLMTQLMSRFSRLRRQLVGPSIWKRARLKDGLGKQVLDGLRVLSSGRSKVLG